MSEVAVLHLARGREWRGGERQVCLLAAAQRASGEVRPTVLTRADSPLARAAAARALPCVHAHWTLPLDLRALAGAAQAVARLRREAAGPLLLHAHDSHALQLGIVLSWWTGARLVATRRSDTPPGRLWRRPRRVIGLSRSVTGRLSASGVAPHRIVQVPSAVDLAALAALRRAPGDAQPPLLLAAGALTQEKGHLTLIEAFALMASRVTGARLVIAGAGPERASLEARIAAHGLAGRIELSGETEDAASRIAGATILVQPSLREALGTAVLEAMALGVPVIASATGGLAELLADDHGELVPPGDAPALAAAMASLLGNPKRRARLAERGLGRAQGFDSARVAAAVAEVYRSALTEP